MTTSFPLTKIPMCEAIVSASLIEWVVKIADPLFNLIVWFKQSNRLFLDIGSTPLDGSSKNNIFVPPIIEQANVNFLLFPPLKFIAYIKINFTLNIFILFKVKFN